MKKIIVVVLILVFINGAFTKEEHEKEVITDNIMFRVIANSNSLDDQYIKQKISADIRTFLTPLLVNLDSQDEVRKIVQDNLFRVDNIIKNDLVENNISYGYNINYGYNLFPEKTSNNTTYKSGYYESLVINLGKSTGENWWCILFPPLCLLEAEDNDTEELKYEFFLSKLLDKIF